MCHEILCHQTLTITYIGPLANLTLIILFSDMLKFSKIIFFKSKNIVKDNNEYLGLSHLLKISLIIQQTYVEMAKVVRYINYQDENYNPFIKFHTKHHTSFKLSNSMLIQAQTSYYT